MKIEFEKILGYIILAGLLFGLFIVVTIPFEMYKLFGSDNFASRRGTA